MKKKWLALFLAACMATSSMTGMGYTGMHTVQAAEVTAKSWSDWVTALSEDAEVAVSLSADKQSFNGNRVEDVSVDYAEAIKTVETGSVILRFKANSLASAQVLLGVRNTAGALSSDITKPVIALYRKSGDK